MLGSCVADLQLPLLDGEQNGGAIPEVLRIKRQIVFLIGSRQRRPQRTHGSDLETFAECISPLRLPYQHRRQGDRSAGCAQHDSKATSSDTAFPHIDVSVWTSRESSYARREISQLDYALYIHSG
jgi:hypothetical protein